MPVDRPVHATRRAILAAGVAGLAASMADALARPTGTRAADGGNALLGFANTATNTTSITNSSDTDTTFLASNTAGGIGVQGSSSSNFGVLGTSATGYGAVGESGGSAKSGVFGRNTSGAGPGVSGTSGTGAISQPIKTGVYGFANQDAGAFGVSGESGSGTGVYGESTSGNGSMGVSASAAGVVGASGGWPDSTPAAGVVGVATNGTFRPGVYGWSSVDVGVKGEGAYGVSGIGVYTAVSGYTSTPESTAVYGGADSATGETYGLAGHSASPDGIGTMSWHVGNGLALAAHSGSTDTTVAPQLHTAILGIASQTANSARGVVGRTTAGYGIHGQVTIGRGVYGQATTGQGVRGYATGTTGTAGHFSTPTASGVHKGTALVADGRVKFPNCVGVKAFLAGATSVVVTPGIDLSSTSAAIATITGVSVGVFVVRTQVNATANTFTIFLSGPATGAGKVAWHVFG